MIDKLRLNTNLFSFGGVIGRRDYALNLIYIWAINVFFVLPYNAWVFLKVENISEIVNLGKLFASCPTLLKIWFILGTIFVSVLTVANAIKRLNDISGKENNILNVSVSILIVLSFFSIMFPMLWCLLISFVATIVGFILIFKKGEITSKYPYDVTKVFNWGAFLGTWIWGLFNKSYAPLFMLLLFWTPWSFCFQLYCGLKGNEWAYKNKKWKNVQVFNKSQEKQTTFWAIFNLLIVPVSYFILVFGFLIYMFSGVTSSSPEKREQTMQKLEKFLVDVGNSYFTNYKITEKENKFYILENEWKYYLYNEKKEILEMAAQMAVIEKEKAWKEKQPEREKLKEYYLKTNNMKEYAKISKMDFYTSKYSELPKTKIYGANTGQLLAEYVDDGTKSMKDASFTDYVKKSIKAYRFYNVVEAKK